MPPKRKAPPPPGQQTLDSFLEAFKKKAKKAKEEGDVEQHAKSSATSSSSPGRRSAPRGRSPRPAASPHSSNTAPATSGRYSLRGIVVPPTSIYAIEADPHYKPNYLFYSNQIESKPRGARISYIHANWWSNYGKLEEHHGYIQWLFPLFKSSGMNSHSHCLTKGEAKLIRENRLLANRFITSYKMMLNFYGMKLECEVTGKIVRHPSHQFQRERYGNLQHRSHNYLRISRILQCLSHLGFRKWKEPLVRFLYEEIEKNKELSNCRGALFEHWIPLLDEDSEEYFKETLERSDDRTDSVYFSQIEKEIRENRARTEIEIIEDLSPAHAHTSSKKPQKKEKQTDENQEEQSLVLRLSSSNESQNGKSSDINAKSPRRLRTSNRSNNSDDKTEEMDPIS